MVLKKTRSWRPIVEARDRRRWRSDSACSENVAADLKKKKVVDLRDFRETVLR